MSERPRWPMIVLVSPKGWTGPKFVDGKRIEGTFRSHQVPITDPAKNPEHLEQLEELAAQLPAGGAVRRERAPESGARGPRAPRAIGAWAPIPMPTADCCCATCECPTLRTTRWMFPNRAFSGIGDTHVLGKFLRDVAKLNASPRNFRIFGPDETLSNGLEAVFEIDRPAMVGDRRT